MIAMAVSVTIIGGVLAAFVQTRRLAAASIAQNCAVTIVQGYIEQIKNIQLMDFVNGTPGDALNNPNLAVSYDLHTQKGPSTADEISLHTTPSTVAAATLLNAAVGTTPTGVYDNLQTFDMDIHNANSNNTWAAIWPNANTALVAYPSTTPGSNDLRMNIWVQISDLTPTAAATCKAYGVLVVYTWQYTDGAKIRWGKDSVRTVRSIVQTF